MNPWLFSVDSHLNAQTEEEFVKNPNAKGKIKCSTWGIKAKEVRALIPPFSIYILVTLIEANNEEKWILTGEDATGTGAQVKLLLLFILFDFPSYSTFFSFSYLDFVKFWDRMIASRVRAQSWFLRVWGLWWMSERDLECEDLWMKSQLRWRLKNDEDESLSLIEWRLINEFPPFRGRVKIEIYRLLVATEVSYA